MFNSEACLRQAGFVGFLSIAELSVSGLCSVPNEPGVYIILRRAKALISFLTVGSGGHFKGRNPNVSLEELQANWVEGALVLYIGKAGSVSGISSLRSRLKQYVAFGEGRPVGHWGGRLIWQLSDAEELIVAWNTKLGISPRSAEKELIRQFVNKFGCRPFANLKS